MYVCMYVCICVCVCVCVCIYIYAIPLEMNLLSLLQIKYSSSTTPMVGAERSPETLVNIYQSTCCHVTQSIYLKSHVRLIYEYHTCKFCTVWKLACLSGFVIKRKVV